jgi:hypothetical protein
MAYPTLPDGCLQVTDFGIDCSTLFISGKPIMWYMYAVVPYLRAPISWGGSKFGTPLNLTVSRAVDVAAGNYYDDQIEWVNPTGDQHLLISTEDEDDITDVYEWTARQEQDSANPALVQPWTQDGCPFGVLEIKSWNDTSSVSGSKIIAFSVEFVHVLDYDEPGASSLRQHIERMPPELYAPGSFASAYQAQWGIVESLNRAIYTDRHANTWPVARRAPT